MYKIGILLHLQHGAICGKAGTEARCHPRRQATPQIGSPHQNRRRLHVFNKIGKSIRVRLNGEFSQRWVIVYIYPVGPVAQQFCGRCGAKMEKSTTERAMVCPACGQIEYPKICPAVIVAVTHGDKLLLTRYANRPFRGYALIAGFVEIGETLEDTVHREVMEEVGVKVKNLRYYKNQPWAFTDTLLTGFYCELDGDPDITLDHNELCEGVWLSREEIPSRENDISLTAEMIERFRLGLA